MACRERELLERMWALGTDGAERRPGLNFPPSPAPLVHAYLRGSRPPHSPLSHRPPPPLPAPLPADSLARTSLGLPLADWLRPSGPSDVISETWQPGESAPHEGGGGEGLEAVLAADGGWGWGRSGDSDGLGDRGRNPKERRNAEAGKDVVLEDTPGWSCLPCAFCWPDQLEA